MLLILVFAPLCITTVFCAVFESAGDDLAKNARNVSVDSIVDQKFVNNISSVIETNVNDTTDKTRSYVEETRKEGGNKNKKGPDLMSKILPMLIIPFLLQTAIIPMILTMLKFMLLKTAFIGKMAILLGLLNLFRKVNNEGGVYTHNIMLEHESMPQRLAGEHYGYSGSDEYGAYVNRRKRTFKR